MVLEVRRDMMKRIFLACFNMTLDHAELGFTGGDTQWSGDSVFSSCTEDAGATITDMKASNPAREAASTG